MMPIECPSCRNAMEIEENEPNTEWECPSCAAAFLVQRNRDGAWEYVVTEASPDAGQIAAGLPPEPVPLSQEPGVPDEVYVAALESLLKGKRPREVRKGLVKSGYSGSQAEHIVRTAVQFQKDKEMEEKLMPNSGGRTGQTNMVIGGIVFLVGLVLTLGTMAMASGGGTYVVAWGAIVFGGLQFLRGLAQSRNS